MMYSGVKGADQSMEHVGMTVDSAHAWLIGISLALIAVLVLLPKRASRHWLFILLIFSLALMVSWLALATVGFKS